MKVMGAHNPIKHYDCNLYHICLSLSHNKKTFGFVILSSQLFFCCYYNNTIVTRCRGLVVKAPDQEVMNSNLDNVYWMDAFLLH